MTQANPLSDLERSAIARYAQSGWPPPRIARELHRSVQVITQALKDANITIQTPASIKRGHDPAPNDAALRRAQDKIKTLMDAGDSESWAILQVQREMPDAFAHNRDTGADYGLF